MRAALCALAVLLALPWGNLAAGMWPAQSRGDDLLEVLEQMVQGPLDRPVLSAADVDNDEYTRQAQSFNCSDVRCSGWLYLPKHSVDGSSRPPVVVMAHGLGGTKSWLDGYASTFAKNGFAVFSFDYRYWGGSEGMPRQWISIKQQLADWRSAVEYVQQQLTSEVDPQRLSLWGTSFAGGHVITTAAALGDQVKSVISQVPHLDGPLASMNSLRNRGTVSSAVLALAALADSRSENNGTEQFYVPLGGPVKSLALMQLNEEEQAAYEKLIAQRQSEGWHNLARASFVLELAREPYSPINSISKVSAPILLIAATKDTICPYSAARSAAARARRATLVPIAGMHFDIYTPPFRDEAVAQQVAFLLENAV